MMQSESQPLNKNDTKKVGKGEQNKKIDSFETHKGDSPDINKTPQFPFNKWQVYFHLTFISLIVVLGVISYQSYIVEHFQQIKPLLKRSYLSSLIQIAFQNTWNDTVQIVGMSQNLQPFEIFPGVKISFHRFSQDKQWEAYRNNLWILISMACAWRFLAYLAFLLDKFIFTKQKDVKSQNQFAYVNSFVFVFSFFILLFSFRADIVFYISIILAWYVYVYILLTLRKKNIFDILPVKKFDQAAILSFWIIMLVTLYLNQKYEHFRSLSEWLQTYIPDSMQPMKNSYRAIHCSQLLNMTFLRLLSYGIDRIHQGDSQWQQVQARLKTKKLILCEQCQIIPSQNNDISKEILFCYKGRDHIMKTQHSLQDYLNYTLFTPLMLTGPPVSYNNFFSFQIYSAPQLTWKNYAYHIFLIFSFELYQHLFPVITPMEDMTLIQMELFSLMHLFFIWFKFLIIWRTAKIWAQMYGVHVIDNMSRCMLNNYGFEGFWRMWHRGFNHWLIRYLYVPLGGRQNIMSVLAVVAFVAFWHDHTINIIFWALIIALFMVPEMLIKRYFRSKKKHLFGKYWFKYLSGVISAIYIYFLIICNLIGFGYGIGKIPLVLEKLSNNIFQLMWSVTIITSACMLMFYKRNMQNNAKNY